MTMKREMNLRALEISHELTRITDMWVEAALTLTPADLRKMERLASAQDRRWAAMNRTAAQ